MDKALIFFAKSRYADLFGVALVVAIAIGSGYLSTNLAKYVDWGPWTSIIPLGLISVINVGISMMSTRLTGRLSNVGNVLGIINTALSFAFSLIANYIGYGGKTTFLFWITTVVFGLSLSANILNALKLSMQWQFWLFYNLVQCVKALTQGNFANVGKYVFYIINSVAALLLWTRSGTAAKEAVVA